MTHPVVDALAGGLVVSCQAPPGHPLATTSTIVRLARCAELGGAAGVRINHPRQVRAVEGAVGLPVIGLHKTMRGRYLITTSFDQAASLVAAGADIVAIEATFESGLDTAAALIAKVRAELQVPVMADVSNVAEAACAWDAGADLVGTTLSGYTPDSPHLPGPDLLLVEELARRDMRVVAEGRYATAGEVNGAFERGAHAVVVGGAITDPVAITRSLVSAIGARR